MNINAQGLKLTGGYASKSTLDRLQRQQQRDDQIAFIEKQKDNLKNLKTDSIEGIKHKLELLQGYEDQITAVKAAYNHTQMYHMLDEGREFGEKIADEVKKNAPKTPEERREYMIEEATGVEKPDGLLADIMGEFEETSEKLEEVVPEELVRLSEEELQDLSTHMEEAGGEMNQPSGAGEQGELLEEIVMGKPYERIDYRI
ncbi:MAG: hypothetical protein IJT34_09020 [Butyrivibrio sp.]|nr:hypothetical protein [Butyrivibrio sp.]